MKCNTGRISYDSSFAVVQLIHNTLFINTLRSSSFGPHFEASLRLLNFSTPLTPAMSLPATQDQHCFTHSPFLNHCYNDAEHPSNPECVVHFKWLNPAAQAQAESFLKALLKSGECLPPPTSFCRMQTQESTRNPSEIQHQTNQVRDDKVAALSHLRNHMVGQELSLEGIRA